MIKQAPTAPRLLAIVLFVLSCFGLLLFLWLRFGGAIPLGPEGYRVQVAFPEAVQLGANADVRSAGITIGKVKERRLDKESGRSLATLELESRYAPLPRDARAILRTKTLLGETYVELSLGNRNAPKLPDGGRLADSRVAPTVELDEVFQSFDPDTRRAFRIWQQELSVGVHERGQSLNRVLGNLPSFTRNGIGLLDVLNRHEREVQGLIRDTGTVYGALTRDEAQLRNLIVNSHGVFRQTAREREALAEAFGIFPTFLDESKVTLKRVERFARNTRPLIRDLRPVARELPPTLTALHRLAPHLRRFFVNFDAQNRASRRGLPASTDTLRATRPLVRGLGPFLQELNPVIDWLELHQHLIADFLGYGASGLADTTPARRPGTVGHYLRQLAANGTESVGIHRTRLSSNRGNAYLPPIISGPETSRRNIFPNWDCKPAGGERDPSFGQTPASPGCWIAPKLDFQGRRQRQHVHVERADYSGG